MRIVKQKRRIREKVWRICRLYETLYKFFQIVDDWLSFSLCPSAVLYIRKPEAYWPNWTTFFSPLKCELWLYVAAAALLLSAGLSATSILGSRYGNEGPHWYTVSDSILCVFGSFCCQGKLTRKCDKIFWITFRRQNMIYGTGAGGVNDFSCLPNVWRQSVWATDYVWLYTYIAHTGAVFYYRLFLTSHAPGVTRPRRYMTQ
jgi:hypothetical protein